MTRCHSGPVPGPMQSLLETGSMAGMTDRELVDRFAAHRDAVGEAAFAVLVARHGPMVLGVCRYLLANDHDADDAFQAVFLVLARRAGTIRRPDLLGPWLHGAAIRIASKARIQAYRRRRHEREEVEMTHVEPAGEAPDPRADRDEEAAAVHEEIGRLPERYRRAVVLCHLEGLTHAQAALRLGCAPGTVGSLVSRARDMLRNRLTRRGLSAGAIALAGSMEPGTARAAVPLALERATTWAAFLFATGPAAVAGIASASAVELAGGALKTMTLNKLAIVGSLVVGLAVVAIASGLAAGTLGSDDPRPARVQEQPRTGAAVARAPHLPGAVTQPPPWLDKDAPFDVAAFFAAPPPEQNAAPLYLDALFEFDSVMADCFPDDPDREGRKKLADERVGRLKSAAPTAIDAILDEYQTGFRKLDMAQLRPRCVFQSGLGITAVLPHCQAALHRVGEVTERKVRRELDRGDIDAALRDIARHLRLSRDLLPRGERIVGHVSSAMDVFTVKSMIMPVLTAPGLTTAHCDRLLALLLEHEAQSVDAYSEGLRADYLSYRATWHELIFDQGRLREQQARIGKPVGASSSIVAAIADNDAPPEEFRCPPPGASVARKLGAMSEWMKSLKSFKQLDALIARTTPEDLSGQVAKLNELYRGLLGAAGAPYLERMRKSKEWPKSLDTLDLHTRVTKGLLSDYTHFTKALSRSKATIRVAEGLIVVRRWQLRHGRDDSPPSLDAAAKEAGLRSLPVDPYDGRPIRLSDVKGQPTVYAVGPDVRDDGGRIDSDATSDGGDVLLRLPGS